MGWLRMAMVIAGLVATGSGGSAEAQAAAGVRRDRAERLCAMGRAWRAAGSPGSASGYFRDAIRVDPTHAAAYAELGRVYLDRGAVNDALEVLHAGRRYRPDDARLGRLLARALSASGRHEQALTRLRELLRTNADDVEAHAARAELARRQGAWSEALAAYRALIDLAARGRDVSEQQLAEAQRYARALTLLAAELDPVRGAVDCAGDVGAASSPVRRALAGCPR